MLKLTEPVPAGVAARRGLLPIGDGVRVLKEIEF